IAELLRRFDRRLATSRSVADPASAAPAELGSDERELEERVLEPFLGSTGPAPAEPRSAPPRIAVGLALADIARCHEIVTSELPIDAIAGGIYSGVRPCGAVHALDASVSKALPLARPPQPASGNSPNGPPSDVSSEIPVNQLLLTQ